MNWWKHCSLLLLAALSLRPAVRAEEPTKQDILSWAMSVAIGAEYDENKVVYSRRWVNRPVVSFFGADPVQKKVLLETVAGVDQLLHAGGFGMRVSPKDADEDASMRVYLVNFADMPKKAKELGFTYVEGNWGFFYTKFVDNEIVDATVFLAKDKLDKLLSHVAYEEITQAMGFGNDSGAFPDSIFYSSETDSGSAPRPSKLDSKLVGWFYRNVPPGSTREQFRRIFTRTWDQDAGTPSNEMAWWWLKKLALHPQIDGTLTTRRWKAPPVVQVIGGNESQKLIVGNVVENFDHHLKPTGMGISMAKSPKDQGSMQIYFAPTSEFPDLARKLNVNYAENNDGYFNLWAADGVITGAVIFLSSDRLDDALLRHFCSQQLMRVLGMEGTSPAFVDSIWFLDGDDSGKLQEPTKLDWQALDWFYRYVPEGSKEIALHDAFIKNWEKSGIGQ